MYIKQVKGRKVFQVLMHLSKGVKYSENMNSDPPTLIECQEQARICFVVSMC